jgi:hypothetical protein
LRHETHLLFDIGIKLRFHCCYIHITGTFAGARFATQFKYFIQFFVVKLIVFSECVRYSRNALALARVVSFFRWHDNWDTKYHQPKVIFCNHPSHCIFPQHAKFPYYPRNPELFVYPVPLCPLPPKVFIHFESVYTLPTFKIVLGSKASLILLTIHNSVAQS